jgi:hypothetical protein
VNCSCAHHADGSTTATLCSLHADQDPCERMAQITGKRRKGTIRAGRCTACGWTEPKPAAEWHVWVSTSSHRSRDRLIRLVGWRPQFGKPQTTGMRFMSGSFYRIPRHRLEAALRIPGVTHAKTLTRADVRAYRQTRPSQKESR